MIQVTDYESGYTTYISIEQAIYRLRINYPIEKILEAIAAGKLITTEFADYLPIKQIK